MAFNFLKRWNNLGEFVYNRINMELLQLRYPEISVQLISVSLITVYIVFVYYFVNVSFHFRAMLYT